MSGKSLDYALMNILREYSDDAHRLTLEQLAGYLEEGYGIRAERKAIGRHLHSLLATGADISLAADDHSWGCCLREKALDPSELKVMLDALATAYFISPKTTAALQKKLLGLTDVYHQKELRSQAIVNRHKAAGPNIFYAVAELNKAIALRQAVQFTYLSYVLRGQEHYHGSPNLRRCFPGCLVWENDHYYCAALLAPGDPRYAAEKDNHRIFRIDKIRRIRSLELSAPAEPFDYDGYVSHALAMYSGPKQSVTLELTEKGLALALDLFSSDPDETIVKELPEGPFACRFSCLVEISPVFFARVFQLGREGRLAGPAELRKRYRQLLRAAAGQ